MADAIRGSSKDAVDQHRGLLYAFLMTPFVCALGGACFLIASFFLVKDKAAIAKLVRGETEENKSLINNSLGDDDEETPSFPSQENNAVEHDIDDKNSVFQEGEQPTIIPTQESEPSTTLTPENKTLAHPIKV